LEGMANRERPAMIPHNLLMAREEAALRWQFALPPCKVGPSHETSMTGWLNAEWMDELDR
jgi:hypothetical protein